MQAGPARRGGKGDNPWSARAAMALAAALIAAAPACQKDEPGAYFGTAERHGKDFTTFYVNASAEPEFLDPGKSNDTASGVLIYQMFEGLTSYAPGDLHATQGAATRWDRSDDNRIFRFHLRPEARWSDGKPVTAHDFEYAWKRALRPATASTSATNLHVIKNAELFNLGKLKALREGAVVRAEPREDAPAAAAALPAGSFVVVLKSAGGFAQIAPHRGLPTYDPGAPAADAAAQPAPVGFVAEKDLVEDDRAVGVRAAGDGVLEVELERPTPYFTDLTGVATFMPVRRDVVEPFEKRGEADLWFRPGNIVVNGPYILDEWKFRYEITMKRNPAYWDRDRLKIHRIVWLSVEQVHPAMNLYKTGELDYLGDNSSLPTEYMVPVSTKKDFHRYETLGSYWYEFNVTRPPVDNPLVRRALNLAVDKKQIIDRILRAGQRVATHYVPDYTGSGYAEQVAEDQQRGADPFTAPEVTFNPERARALLKEAGYPVVEEDDGYRAQGFPPLEVLYNTHEGHRAIAVAVQDMWRRHLGISVTLRNEEWKVMLKSVRDGHYQIARFGWNGEYNHPHSWMATFLTGSPQNRTGWSDKEFDDLIRTAAATADPKESIRLYRKAEARAVAGMAKLPFYFYTKSTLLKPWVKGFRGNPRGMQLVKWLWLDPGWRESTSDEVAIPGLDLPPPGRLLPLAGEARP